MAPRRTRHRLSATWGHALSLALPLFPTACGNAGGSPLPDGSTQTPPPSGPTANTFDFIDAEVTASCSVPQIDGYPNGSCGPRGLHCIATDTECCDCALADMNTCGVSTSWICGDHGQRPCPATPPSPGSACDAGQLANSGCTYCTPPGGSYVCQTGNWQRVLDYVFCSRSERRPDAGTD